jgi:hypothetical protein
MAENEKIQNTELLEAIKDMRADFNPQSQSKVINLALRGTYLVPAVISKNTQLVADKDNHLKFQDKPQAKFLLVKHQKNGTFFPIFTDSEEFAKLKSEDNFQPVKMKFSDIAQLTEQTPTVEGFVINPMSTNLPFPKVMLEQIKQTLLKARRERDAAQAAQQAEAQGITVSSADTASAENTSEE